MNNAPPPSEPAIDVAGGMERVLGDRRMFMRILQRFQTDYRNAAASLRAALGVGDAALAHRLAHTLKGAAGMIEARALHRRALALEQAARAQRDDCGLQLDLMEAELDRVLREIDVLLGGAEAEAPAAAASPAAADPVGQLRALLDVGDGAAVEMLSDARASLEAALGASRFGELAAAVDTFDFERALRVLDQTT